MFERAFLQERGGGRLEHEETLLKTECDRRGIPVVLYTIKKIQRGSLDLGPTAFIAGDVDAMQGAMRQLRIPIPPVDDYPSALQPYLYRSLWRSTLGEVERMVVDGGRSALFAKPADRRKSFTGRVFDSGADFALLGETSRRQEVVCSDRVTWVSEYRVYVTRQEIVSVDLYSGDAAVPLDLSVVRAALAALQSAGRAPAAYGIDFGVLAGGQTALVEMNDGYSLGAYAIGATAYTDLLMARWQELLATAVA